MSTVIKRKPFRYEWERVVRGSTLPAAAKLVALTLATYANGSGENAHPGVARLVGDTSTSERSVNRQLKALREVYGLIYREAHGGSRRRWADAYRLVKPEDLDSWPWLRRDLPGAMEGVTPMTPGQVEIKEGVTWASPGATCMDATTNSTVDDTMQVTAANPRNNSCQRQLEPLPDPAPTSVEDGSPRERPTQLSPSAMTTCTTASIDDAPAVVNDRPESAPRRTTMGDAKILTSRYLEWVEQQQGVPVFDRPRKYWGLLKSYVMPCLESGIDPEAILSALKAGSDGWPTTNAFFGIHLVRAQGGRALIDLSERELEKSRRELLAVSSTADDVSAYDLTRSCDGDRGGLSSLEPTPW